MNNKQIAYKKFQEHWSRIVEYCEEHDDFPLNIDDIKNKTILESNVYNNCYLCDYIVSISDTCYNCIVNTRQSRYCFSLFTELSNIYKHLNDTPETIKQKRKQFLSLCKQISKLKMKE